MTTPAGATGAEPYVLRWPITARTIVPELLGPAVLVGWLVLSPRIGGHRPPGIFWAFLVLVVGLRAVQFRNGRVALEVGPKGIRLGQTANRYSRRLVAVPWRSIAEVVVLAPRMSAPEDLATNVGEVGVRLRPGAPLPAGVRGIVREPGGTGPLVTRPLRGSTLDQTRLAGAVSAYAPGLRVVELPPGA
ncbi:MAG: hypothetical protein ACR2J0_10240 [Mycobacteriales bacterium]